MSAFVSVFVAASAFFGALTLFDGPKSAPEWDGRFGGVTYSGYRPGQGPAQHRYPSSDEVRRDLALLHGLTGRIRTYTSTEGPDVPALAAELGLKVMAGAWLDGTAKDDSELRGLWRQARTHPNIDRLIVGNETLLREDLSVAELIARLNETRKHTSLPVSTAEPWGIWLAHPDLARQVDFIAIHLLPYWEWKSVDLAVDHAIRMYLKVRQAYPDKPIVIAETGWPSHGEAHGAALATIRNQSLYLRNFTKQANDLGLDYYVVEAFDQQWKRDEEGRPGPHWGIMDAERRMKFQGSGVIWGESGRPSWLAWSSVAGFCASLLFCLVLHRLSLRVKIAFGLFSFAMAYLVAWYAIAHTHFYAESWSSPVRATLIVMTALGMLVLLVQVIEACEVLGSRKWLRAFGPRPLAADAEKRMVSIHLACANEPPAMVIRALESLNRLDWINLEVIVVDNNTADQRLWKPVEAWVSSHADRFRFFHLPECPGFKAGALNYALEQTDPRVSVIGVIDADYLVSRNWIRDLVGHFEDHAVAVVQAPQAHREFQHSLVQQLANWEFEGFFRIGMHHRNERNAIIQHGTMTLVRAEALRVAGGWAEWTICEDAELGLSLMEQGWETRYIDIPYGHGLAPADFSALRSQRRRWALGAMQILRHHLPALLGPSRLTMGQRFHFLTGWMPWMMEAIQLAGVLFCLAWTAAMLAWPRYCEPPIPAELLGLYAVSGLRVAIGIALHRRKVKCRWSDTFGAAAVSVALGHSIAQGILGAWRARPATFVVTRKGTDSIAPRSHLSSVREEIFLFVALMAAAFLVTLSYGLDAPHPVAWAATLVVLALPYGLALLFAHQSSRERSAVTSELNVTIEGSAT